MKSKINLVGNYKLGMRNIRLIVNSESGNGSVELIPEDGGATEVSIGIDGPYPEALSTLLHEIYEATWIDLNVRYGPRPSYSEESSDFIFVASHNQMSEAHERVGYLLFHALPDFAKAYKKYSTFGD